MERKQLGRIGLSKAIDYFTLQNFTISLPLNDTQWYDLIIEKDGLFQTVQCKSTNTNDNKIDLRSTGGTNGKEYDNVLNHNVTYLFCVDNNFKCYNIPVNDLRIFNIKNSIHLREEPNKNHQGFETYKYLIK